MHRAVDLQVCGHRDDDWKSYAVWDLMSRQAGKYCGGAARCENHLCGNRRNESPRLFLRNGNLLFLP